MAQFALGKKKSSKWIGLTRLFAFYYRKALRLMLRIYAKSPQGMAFYAYQRVAIYRRLYRNLMTPKGANFNFQGLPLLTKNEVAKSRPASFLNQAMVRKVRRYAQTTGSLGRPTSSFYSAWEFKRINLLFELIPQWQELKQLSSQGRRAAFALNGIVHGYTVAGHVFGQALERAGLVVAHVGSRSTIARPQRIAQTIASLKPKVIAATPTDFLCWMKIIRESTPKAYHNVIRNLSYLISSAELCSRARSKRLEEEFQIRHLNIYGSVEGFFTIPCDCGRLHIPEIFKAEVAGMDLSDIREEGRGRLIFTNLARKSSPFVRYLLDDDVTIERFNGDQSKGKCREEYAFSIVPHGRSELGVYTSKGLFGIGHFEEELFRSGLFADYTITVNDADDMDVAGINGFDQEHILVRAETYHDGDAVGDLQIKMVRQIEKNFEVKFGLKTRCELMPMGTLFDYRAVRESKPLWRLRDERATHTQRYPVHV